MVILLFDFDFIVNLLPLAQLLPHLQLSFYAILPVYHQPQLNLHHFYPNSKSLHLLFVLLYDTLLLKLQQCNLLRMDRDLLLLLERISLIYSQFRVDHPHSVPRQKVIACYLYKSYESLHKICQLHFWLFIFSYVMHEKLSFHDLLSFF